LKKILAVDDDPMILQTLSIALGQKGYDVMVTSSPTEVEQLVEKTPVDLVILDIHMPVKNGIEVLRDLKKQHAHMRVLFVTAYTKSLAVNSSRMLELWQQELADGETDILYKPFTLDLLFEKINGLIGPAGKNHAQAPSPKD
jgi:DNA-binding response OmpR family regulator